MTIESNDDGDLCEYCRTYRCVCPETNIFHFFYSQSLSIFVKKKDEN